MSDNNGLIDADLVHRLVASQFPQWAHLSIKPVKQSGWDNRTFHLGEAMLVRLPSAACYSPQAQKEFYWLPKLAPHLPVSIPHPLALGTPNKEYPWHWSIYQWLEGETLTSEQGTDLCQVARDLAQFLVALRQIDSTEGPVAGPHNFYRGGALALYDAQTQEAIALLGAMIDTKAVTAVWKRALSSSWEGSPVWVHGDVAVGNVLVKERRLTAVIDFGCMGTGDPACDGAIAWTFFKGESRKTFFNELFFDNATVDRARGWALWKALIVCAKLSGANPSDIEKSKHVIEELVGEYYQNKETL